MQTIITDRTDEVLANLDFDDRDIMRFRDAAARFAHATGQDEAEILSVLVSAPERGGAYYVLDAIGLDARAVRDTAEALAGRRRWGGIDDPDFDRATARALLAVLEGAP